MENPPRDEAAKQRERENFGQEALRSWAEFQRTGRHLTLQEIGDWLGTWGEDEDVPLPECHE